MSAKLTKNNAPVELSEQELDTVAGGTRWRKRTYTYAPKPPVICGILEDGIDVCTGERVY